MARRPARGGGGGGFKSGLVTAVTILIVGGFIWGWAQANNITTLGGVMDYFRSWYKEIEECGATELEWNCSTPIPGFGPTEPETLTEALATLAAITIAEPQDVDYVRSEWRHWSDFDGDTCDAREETLKASGVGVVTNPSNCKIVSGTWIEPYSNTEITDSSKIDIDHVVPLSYAAANGGQALSTMQKEQFANDPMNLYISAPSENRSKGGKGVSKYLPPNKEFQCQYVISFVSVIAKYELTMSQAEVDAARKVLEKEC